MVTAKEFLDRILPANGWRIAVISEVLPSQRESQLAPDLPPSPADELRRPAKPRIVRQHTLPNNTELAAYLLSWDAAGYATYHACASFRDPKGIWDGQRHRKRTHENALAARAFWLDVDAGPNKPYVDASAAAMAALEFIRVVALPVPMFVGSGNGLHLYWPLDADVDVETWTAHAKGLRFLCAKHGFQADAVRTADISSILRTPGTVNRKQGLERPVLCERLEGPYPISAFAKLLDHVEATPQRKQQAPLQTFEAPDYLRRSAPARISEAVLRVGEPAPTSSDKIADACAQVRRLRDWKRYPPLSNPLWYAGLGVLAFATDGHESAHRWGSDHPQYSQASTQETLDRKAALSGATTCEHFAGLEHATCQACPWFGRIRSPIILGFGETRPASNNHGTAEREAPRVERGPNQPSGVPASEPRAAPTAGSLPKLPPNFRWSGISLVFVQGDKTSIEGIETKVSTYPIYLIDVVSAEKVGDISLVFEQWLPNRGFFQMVLSASAFAGSEGGPEMARQGANIHSHTHFVLYTRHALDTFWSEKKDSIRYGQYGWKEGNAFLLGRTLFMAHGHTAAPGSKEVETRNQWIGAGCNAKGDLSVGLERWRQAASALFASGCEAQSICLLASFAAPLMRFLSEDEGGAIVSLVTRQSGTGKTTALAGASSVWGDKHGLSLTNDDNRVAKFLTLACLGNLPVVFDEIQARDPLVLREFVITFTNGRDKQRGDRSGQSVIHSGAWQTLCITASNTSLVEALQQTSKADAPSYRVLELPFEIPESLSTVFGDRLKNELIKNAGFAGEEYVRWLVKPGSLDWVKKALRDAQENVQARTNLSHEHRFWIRTITAIIVAATIVHHLRLLEFSPDRISEWLIDQYHQTPKQVQEAKRAANEWVVDALSDMIGTEQGNFLLLPRWPQRGESVHPLREQRNKIIGTFIQKENTLLFSTLAMKAYAVANEIPYEEWRKSLRKMDVIGDIERRVLTAGTSLAGAQVSIVPIDMGHKLMAGTTIGIKPGDDITNVTPMRRR